jgi:hypothetical protein
VVDKLTAGCWVADVGCGFGYSTIVMAQAFPSSTFIGFDYHRPSIEAASKLAADAGVADRVSFEVPSAQEFPGTALCLARRGLHITVVADQVSPGTTSNVAGALWEWPPAVCGRHHDDVLLAPSKAWSLASYQHQK